MTQSGVLLLLISYTATCLAYAALPNVSQRRQVRATFFVDESYPTALWAHPSGDVGRDEFLAVSLGAIATAFSGPLAAVAAPTEDDVSTRIKSGLDSLERQKAAAQKQIEKEAKTIKKEAKKIQKEVKKEVKAAEKEAKKEIKVMKKEAKKIDKEVKKEAKKINKEVKKEAKKINKEVKKEAQNVDKAVKKGAETAGKEVKKIGDVVDKGARSVIGGGSSSLAAPQGGVDVSKLKVCDNPRGKCL